MSIHFPRLLDSGGSDHPQVDRLYILHHGFYLRSQRFKHWRSLNYSTVMLQACSIQLSGYENFGFFGSFRAASRWFPQVFIQHKNCFNHGKKQHHGTMGWVFNVPICSNPVGTELHLVPTSSSRDRHLSPCVPVRYERDCHPHTAESFHHLELEIPGSSRKRLLVPQETLAKLVYN